MYLMVFLYDFFRLMLKFLPSLVVCRVRPLCVPSVYLLLCVAVSSLTLLLCYRKFLSACYCRTGTLPFHPFIYRSRVWSDRRLMSSFPCSFPPFSCVSFLFPSHSSIWVVCAVAFLFAVYIFCFLYPSMFSIISGVTHGYFVKLTWKLVQLIDLAYIKGIGKNAIWWQIEFKQSYFVYV